MPISNSAYLFGLIKSLTKAEKRNFRLYAKRNHDDDSMLFIQLFDALDKMNNFDEDSILKRLDHISKMQLSNLKRHLYHQILRSLRLIHAPRINSIEIRENIDYAHVLYAKGLYIQSLKILQRAKQIAKKEEEDLLHLEIVEFQKIIESRHITNTGPVKNDALTYEAKEVSDRVDASISLSNLRVRLHGYYIKNSHVKNEDERNVAIRFLNDNLPDIGADKLGYIERIYLYQCYVWHYYILLDFEQCYDYALKWVAVFEEKPELKHQDPDLYMRGYHYVLTGAFHARKVEKLAFHMTTLEQFRQQNYAKFTENSKIFSFLYVHWARLNLHFLRGTYDAGVAILPNTLKRIKRYNERIAPHRLMVFYYKIAWMYLGNGQPGKAVPYVTKIINDDIADFREDIQGYSRLLYLMIHYDLDNFELMSYLVKMVDRFFFKNKSSNRLQQSTLQFFKEVKSLPVGDRAARILEFDKEIDIIRKDPYETRAFMYLDIQSWIKAKIHRQSKLGSMMTNGG